MAEELDLELLARVIDLIDNETLAPRSAMEPHSILGADLGLTRLDILDIYFAIDAVFDVALPLGEEERWGTVADIVRSIQAAIATSRFEGARA